MAFVFAVETEYSVSAIAAVAFRRAAPSIVAAASRISFDPTKLSLVARLMNFTPAFAESTSAPMTATIRLIMFAVLLFSKGNASSALFWVRVTVQSFPTMSLLAVKRAVSDLVINSPFSLRVKSPMT